MSHATFATRSDSIQLTGVEVRNIGHLAEAALTEALSTQEAAPVRRAFGWTPETPMYTFLNRPAAKFMIGDKGPWNLFNVALTTLVERFPCAISLVRLYEDDLGWVEGADRGWLADYYQQCLDAGVARPMAGDAHQGSLDLGAGRVLPPGTRAGWEEVIEWLRAGDEPVVTTLSLGGPSYFPNDRLAVEAGTWQPPAVPGDEDQNEEDHDAWDELEHAQQWDLSISALRILEPRRPRRWTPEDFAQPSLTLAHLTTFAEQIRPGKLPGLFAGAGVTL
jgi:hypothetical protein